MPQIFRMEGIQLEAHFTKIVTASGRRSCVGTDGTYAPTNQILTVLYKSEPGTGDT
jgi:hypothetical protein